MGGCTVTERLFGMLIETGLAVLGSEIVSVVGAIGMVGGSRGGYLVKKRNSRGGRVLARFMASRGAAVVAILGGCDGWDGMIGRSIGVDAAFVRIYALILRCCFCMW